MRNQFLLFTAILFAAVNANAAIRTVSNNLNSPGQFNNIAAAIAAASNGDTIYVQGTAYNYGTAYVNKQLVFFGPGHNPQKQNALPATFDNFYMQTGSNGSKIIGFNVLTYVYAQNQNIDNVSVIHCKIGNRVYLNSDYHDNWLIDGCVFTNTNENIEGYYNQSGHTVRNCILNGDIRNFYNSGQGYHYCNNNIFLRSGNVFSNTYYWYVNNCVFYRANTTQNGWQQFSNCLVYLPQNGTTTFPNGSGHQNANPLFVNFPAAGANFDYSYDFNLQAGSPADNTGNDGTDLGVYGGLGDFEQNGNPRIPAVTEISISNPSVAPGGTLNVTFKSKVR